MGSSGIYLSIVLGCEPTLTEEIWNNVMRLKREDEYREFLERKEPRIEASGFDAKAINPLLWDWQQDIVRWAIKRGRAAIFSDCGTGKTLMSLEWGRQMGKRGLILAPLAVGPQTAREAVKLGVQVNQVDSPVDADGIYITNYEKLHKFEAAIRSGMYDWLICDESSILKSMDGKTRSAIIEVTPFFKYVLMCTATPAPNDLVELGNHAEALAVKTNAEMRAAFFVHDSGKGASGGWRLKGHARDKFWEWVAEWAVYIRRPSDLGYHDGAFVLPKLNIRTEVVTSDWVPSGNLFPGMTKGITGRTEARKATIDNRIVKAVEEVQGDDQWLIWCDLNAEGQAIHKALNGASVLIEGSTPDEKRLEYIEKWRTGQVRCLISKPGIFGFGLNFQHAHKMLFLGLSDSHEKFYQAVRREWRFGQEHDVHVVIVTSDAEAEVVDNVRRKESQAEELAEEIVKAMRAKQIENIKGVQLKKETYKVSQEQGMGWEMKMGDCVERIKEVKDGSIGLTVFSPPFAKSAGGSLYVFNDSMRDMSNCESYDGFFDHFDFLIEELMRVTMPGRLCAVHCQDVACTKIGDGFIGTRAFSDDIRIAFEKRGWIFARRVTIDKNPQAQAIRTKAKTLMFVQKNKDSSWSWPAYADYIMIFQKPGVNPVEVKTDVTNDEWITLAHPCWLDIDESDTLNYRVAREAADDKHITPLQLKTIRNCVRLWSNRGETILDPFAGIASTGYVALEQDREFIGLELKESYYRHAVLNLKAVAKQYNMFAETK